MMKFDMLFCNGIKNPVNRENLSNYFEREFKKAERDNFYTIEVFFPPLFQAVERNKNKLDVEFKKQEERFQNLLSKAKQNELNFCDSYQQGCLGKKGINYEDYKKDQNEIYVKDYTKKLENFTIEKVSTKGIFEFKLADLLLIENALKEAVNNLTPKQLQKKTIFDFLINVKDKEDFINELGRAFPTEKGVSIKVLINELKEKNIIVHGTKEFKLLIQELTNAFGRNIGTYQSINDTKSIDSKIIEPIIQKLSPLINKYKTTS